VADHLLDQALLFEITQGVAGDGAVDLHAID
jgi:hypothetical protein